jgi:hypothetical protein
MRNLITFTPVLFFAVACGGTEGGTKVSSKHDAAQTAAYMQRTGEAVSSRSSSGLGGVPGSLDGTGNVNIGEDGVSAETSFVVRGSEGQATITTKAVISEDVRTEYTIRYEGFTADGVNVLDGEITYTARVAREGVFTEMRGHVDVVGAYDSSLDLDTSVRVTRNGIEISGRITADGIDYNYNGENFNLDADAPDQDAELIINRV